MFDNQRGREWAAHNIRNADSFIEKNESKIISLQRLAQAVVTLTSLALLRKKFKR